MAEIEVVNCKQCGEPLPGNDLADRAPCVRCGSGSIVIQMTAAATITMVAQPVGMTITTQRPYLAADRISQLRRALAELSAPATSAPDADDARQRLRDVFVNLWALRDAAKHEGVAAATIDQSMNATSQMARAHDLGNLAKHPQIMLGQRTGQAPAFVRFETGTPPISGIAWTVDEIVSFDGTEYSGLAIATDALAAWDQLLRRWGLLP